MNEFCHFRNKRAGARTSNDVYDKSFGNVNSLITNLYMFYPWNDGFKRLHFSKELILTRFSYAQMEKGCAFKADLTQFLLQVHSMGFLDYFLWMRLPLEAKDFGKKLPPPSETPLTLESMALSFFILLMGAATAFMFLVFEMKFRNSQWINPYK